MINPSTIVLDVVIYHIKGSKLSLFELLKLNAQIHSVCAVHIVVWIYL
jgi:hypothetical protein